jgi:hypothetical protein
LVEIQITNKKFQKENAKRRNKKNYETNPDFEKERI